ncbi:DMT family transporter [Ramlibacter sp.]|uniref:DMT family transporter n=1 Tax=Ramlibacter sp. TaxID=1917967 RepID=UPI003D114C86
MAERGTAGAPVLALLANAFLWGISWWPFRELQQHGVHPLWSTAFTFVVSFLCIAAFRPGAWRHFAAAPGLWLLALASGVTNVGFNWGVTIGDVVRVVLLFYLMPAWSVLLAWPLLGERPNAAALARLALALAGVGIVLDTGGAGWPWPSGLADWLGLLGGASFALTNIMLRKLNEVDAGARMLAMFGGGAVLASAMAAVGTGAGFVSALPAPDGRAGVIALALAAGFLVSNMALQYGAARLAAHTTALVMLSEVLFASFSSVALGAAELTGRVLAGAALIVAAAAWSAWPVRDAPRPAAHP